MTSKLFIVTPSTKGLCRILREEERHREKRRERGGVGCLAAELQTLMMMYGVRTYVTRTPTRKSTSLQAHTPFHQDITLLHSTAGSEVPLQLDEVLGEASQIRSPPLSSCLAAKRELERKLKWRKRNRTIYLLPVAYFTFSARSSHRRPTPKLASEGKTCAVVRNCTHMERNLLRRKPKMASRFSSSTSLASQPLLPWGEGLARETTPVTRTGVR